MSPPAELVGGKGHYVLGEALGIGGMATVFRARRRSPTRGVFAIKRLHPHLLAEPRIKARFLDEAKIATRLDHPNIVRVEDIAFDGDEPLLVLELVDGASLLSLAYASWNRGERVPLDVASAVVTDLLAALGAAHDATDDDGHACAIVHRDVSPHNLLIGADGVAHLSDFGIARIGHETGSTSEGHFKGKLGYISPEQLAGQSPGPASDLYAVGVVLWELCASRRLFEGDFAQVLGQMLSTTRRPPSEHAPDVGAELDAVVMRAIEPVVDKRFGSAKAMAAALERACAPASRDAVARWVASCRFELPVADMAPPSSAVPSSTMVEIDEPRASVRPRRARRRWLFLGLGASFVAMAGVGVRMLRTSTDGGATASPPVTDSVSSVTASATAEPAPLTDSAIPIAPTNAPPPSASLSASASADVKRASSLPGVDIGRIRREIAATRTRIMDHCRDGQPDELGLPRPSFYLLTFYPNGKNEVVHRTGPYSACASAELAKIRHGPFSGSPHSESMTVGVLVDQITPKTPAPP
ncbi:MAG: serine/threonine protein kinase [Polyangiaceae bacterium]|nr:serine/threonine protein kinase [Polyangiaceae bacterium]